MASTNGVGMTRSHHRSPLNHCAPQRCLARCLAIKPIQAIFLSKTAETTQVLIVAITWSGVT